MLTVADPSNAFFVVCMQNADAGKTSMREIILMPTLVALGSLMIRRCNTSARYALVPPVRLLRVVSIVPCKRRHGGGSGSAVQGLSCAVIATDSRHSKDPNSSIS